jgi:uncharacterized protein YceH (UPF0502 family)
MELTAAEGRVLGCLIEREAIDPDAYPVTLNALRLACNQSTERDPVVAYDDRTVEDTLLALKSKGLARFTPPGKGERTTRYSHRADDRWRMAASELAVLSVLLVGGVQTVSEVRSRARRLAQFTDADEVDAVLDTLAARTPTPFAARLERRSGDGETRWAQVLTGRPAALDDAAPGPSAGSPASAVQAQPAVVRADVGSPSYGELVERLAALEQRLAAALERPAYPSSDWRSRPVPPPPPPPGDGGRLASVQPLTVAGSAPADRSRSLPAAGASDIHATDRMDRTDRTDRSVVSELADRLSDIERRLARIEAELGALR